MTAIAEFGRIFTPSLISKSLPRVLSLQSCCFARLQASSPGRSGGGEQVNKVVYIAVKAHVGKSTKQVAIKKIKEQ